MSELAWVEAGLRRGDVEVVGWLGPEDLARLIRTQYDPAATQGIDKPRRDGRRRGIPTAAAGPMAARAAFTHYRTDSGFHAVYWIASWPRMQVAGGLALPAARARRRASDDLGDRGTRCPVAVLPRGPQRQGPAAHGGSPAPEVRADRAAHSTTRSTQPSCDVSVELVHGHAEYGSPATSPSPRTPKPSWRTPARRWSRPPYAACSRCAACYGEQDQAFVAGALPLARGVR